MAMTVDQLQAVVGESQRREPKMNTRKRRTLTRRKKDRNGGKSER